MAEVHCAAIEINGGGFIHETGEAAILAPLRSGDELHLTFPADDIPNFQLLLSRIYAQNISGRDIKGSLGHKLGVESVQLLPVKGTEEIGMILDLNTGTPVSFVLPRIVAGELQEQLNHMLE